MLSKYSEYVKVLNNKTISTITLARIEIPDTTKSREHGEAQYNIQYSAKILFVPPI